MKLKKIKLINGQELNNYEIDENAVSLSGYFPIKRTDGKQMAYVNSINILYMIVDTDGMQNAYFHTAPFPVKVLK